MATVEETVIQIIADKAMLDVSDIEPDMRLADLGVDSLGLVEAIFALEEAFDITIPFSAQEAGVQGFDISTVSAIVTGIEGLLSQKAA